MDEQDAITQTTGFALAEREPGPGKTQELGPYGAPLPAPFPSQGQYDYFPNGIPEYLLNPLAGSFPATVPSRSLSSDGPALSWHTSALANPDALDSAHRVMLTDMAGALGSTHAPLGSGLVDLGSQNISGLFPIATDTTSYNYLAWLDQSPTLDQASGYAYQGQDGAARQQTESQSEATNSSPRFQCELCGENFANQKNRDRHYLSERHNADAPKFKCACNYTQARKDNYRRHLANCTFPIDVSYSCSCGHQTPDKSEHAIHVEYCRRRRRAKSQRRGEVAESGI
ncbi:Zinc finger protein ZFAT [Madurella fahalii]|uniref:Zinc finger protein ZFAT n=1 Tax=Madurella fahalii TaxID=1157608 RepID=A0ABQ0GQJ0_9PEZI